MALNMNHSTSSTLAIAVSRCIFQCCSPERAAPRPRTLAIGVR